MTYLLDTNACIRHLRGLGRSDVSRRLASIGGADVVLCSIVRAELLYGAERSRDPLAASTQVRRFCANLRSFPFDDNAADHYAMARVSLASVGTPIGPSDLLIAGIALANSLTLVTHNTREFGRIAGLMIDDWET